jgi:hypothetical protein
VESLLQYAYIEQHCSVCGHSYAVTLHDTLMEQRTLTEWQSPRHCSHCRQLASPLTPVIPRDLLEQLENAWSAVDSLARSAGFELKTGTLAGASG